MKLQLETLEKDDEHKETVQMNHDKVKSLRGRWANVRWQLKDEESAVTKLKEQLKQHEESAKAMEKRLPTIRSELGEVVEDLNEARKKDPGGTTEIATMAPPVPEPDLGPTPAESQQEARKVVPLDRHHTPYKRTRRRAATTSRWATPMRAPLRASLLDRDLGAADGRAPGAGVGSEREVPEWPYPGDPRGT